MNLAALTGINRYLALAAAALVLAAIGLGYGWVRAERKVGQTQADLAIATEALKKAQAARKLSDKSAQRLAKELAAAASDSSRRAAAVNSAITANPDWASTPLPKEVQDALQ